MHSRSWHSVYTGLKEMGGPLIYKVHMGVADMSARSVHSRIFARHMTVLLSLMLFCLVFALLAYRLPLAPDLFSDEGLYASVGNNLAAGRGLIENSGTLFIWHPPLYIIVEAVALRAFHLVDSDTVALIRHLRYISVGSAATTAVLLFLIGRRLRGPVSGVVVSLLYCLDPFIQRTARRNMLEVFGEMLLVLGFWLYLRTLSQPPAKLRYAILAGLALGLAGLTKEVLLLGLVVIGVFAIAYQRDRIVNMLVLVLTGGAMYGVYPAWIAQSGHWPNYSAMKSRQLLRLVSRVISQQPVTSGAQISGTHISLWENIQVTLAPYACSYCLLGLAGIVAAILLVRSIRRRGAVCSEQHFMMVWGLVWYAVIGLTTLFGQAGDQFFYYLIVVAVLLIGWTISPIVEYIVWLWHGALAGHRFPDQGLLTLSPVITVMMTWCVLLMTCWNLSIYIQLYAMGYDDSYAELYQYVTANIPPGTTIVAGSDVANYLFPQYRVRFDRTADDLRRGKVGYVILSSKERWGGYNEVTPDFYDWVVTHSTTRFQREGNTFWSLQLFELAPQGDR